MDHHSAYQDINTTMFEDIYNANVQLPTPIHTNIYNKDLAQQIAAYSAAELCQPQQAHLSPIGQANAMLFTPTSLADEGFDETMDYSTLSHATNPGDFILFPGGGVSKAMFNESLFATEVPSLAAGYSQPSSQDLMGAFNVDWAAHDMSAYLPH